MISTFRTLLFQFSALIFFIAQPVFAIEPGCRGALHEGPIVSLPLTDQLRAAHQNLLLKEKRLASQIELKVLALSIHRSKYGAPHQDIGFDTWNSNSAAQKLRADLLAALSDHIKSGSNTYIDMKLPASVQNKVFAMFRKMQADLFEVNKLSNEVIGEIIKSHKIGIPLSLEQVRKSLDLGIHQFKLVSSNKVVTYKNLLEASAIYWRLMQLKSTNSVGKCAR